MFPVVSSPSTRALPHLTTIHAPARKVLVLFRYFPGEQKMGIATVGIIGAGTMGNGIAQACAVAGIRAVMVDISDAAVAKGLATVSGSLDRLLKKEKITEA